MKRKSFSLYVNSTIRILRAGAVNSSINKYDQASINDKAQEESKQVGVVASAVVSSSYCLLRLS